MYSVHPHFRYKFGFRVARNTNTETIATNITSWKTEMYSETNIPLKATLNTHNPNV